ncbi:MAG: hypothetical protein ACK526_16260 [Planctomyces sp.]
MTWETLLSDDRNESVIVALSKSPSAKESTMYAVLYVCIPRSEARTSLQARRKACSYLIEEHFDQQTRFSGHCDRFSVGGRFSGRLTLLRMRSEKPRVFNRLWKELCNRGETVRETKRLEKLFRESFPDYQGDFPFLRLSERMLGHSEDAQIFDEPLFRQLKSGFSDSVDYSFELDEPNVIFTDENAFDWPETQEEAAKFWVVVICYHF